MRTIDVYTASDLLRGVIKEIQPSENDWVKGFIGGLKTARNIVLLLPTINQEIVKHGKWRLVECGTQCTSCTRVFDHHFEVSQQVCSKLKRCPECGAKMEG